MSSLQVVKIGLSESLFVAVVSTFGSALTSGKWKISSRKLFKALERSVYISSPLFALGLETAKKTCDVADIVVPGVEPLPYLLLFYFIHATAVLF